MTVRKKLEQLKELGWTIDDLIEVVGTLEKIEDCNTITSNEEESKKKSENYEEIVRNKARSMMNDLGIKASVKGYQYLGEAITMEVVNGKKYRNSITYKLYPEIAEKYEDTPTRVERAIRTGIEMAWNMPASLEKVKIFGMRRATDKNKPTNSEFICAISEKIKIELEK